ncbi:MAG: hypothetical protein IPL61_14710 [Myxococcales bacterium]|nr:hypothetical protein [Myxococcales bacterium]
MAESQILTLLRAWAAVAWADDKIADAERLALRRLIDGAELTAADREIASGFLETRVELADVGLDGLSPDARRGIYKAACRMAAVDREVADSERAILVRLRDGLGIAVDDAREIEASIPGVTAS